MGYKRISEVREETTDNRTYKICTKWLREAYGEISCSRCPYHRRENDRKSRYSKSWKDNTKRRKQYKGE